MADDAAAPEGELTESTGTELTGSPEESSESPQEASQETTTADAASATDDESGDAEKSDAEEAAAKPGRMRRLLVGAVAALLALGLVGGLGWLGWSVYQQQQAEQKRDVFVQVGRQAAINLTTIDFEDAEAGVQRILDSATGTFYDDFSQRSGPFTEVVKQAQSKSSGEVTAAGLESEEGDRAQVLVAVTVQTSNAGAPEQAPRMWRMRISVENTDDGQTKVSNVEFVP
ncbi:tetratricopeptide repeat protein [[Mycobacterium] wendilense]|uniref:Tetratricopeptide repeat protein n=1 Tax=[Mycobacterium] wendilense TaxID=3064284 RepID=A0ABN9NVF2_9MYCO|nr:tetratricopeptide repeat protein [Mycolicibacterium sp. MU0050]CAJ1580530.1 tetratricopeptide repeat protein [Mycolicibacterium sp. MU0050]